MLGDAWCRLSLRVRVRVCQSPFVAAVEWDMNRHLGGWSLTRRSSGLIRPRMGSCPCDSTRRSRVTLRSVVWLVLMLCSHLFIFCSTLFSWCVCCCGSRLFAVPPPLLSKLIRMASSTVLQKGRNKIRHFLWHLHTTCGVVGVVKCLVQP